MDQDIKRQIERAVDDALLVRARESATTEAIPVSVIPTALKFITSGWGVALILGGYFGVRLFFSEIALDRANSKYEATQILLDNERNTSASLMSNINSLQSQAARKAADEAAAAAAKDALDEEPVTSFNPPSIKRAISILRNDQQTDAAEDSESDVGEPVVSRRARGTTPRRD